MTNRSICDAPQPAEEERVLVLLLDNPLHIKEKIFP